jgi:uncharacterized protein YndB with AHSA1/START domain
MTVQAAIQIGKPSGQVFEAIVDPDIMKNYFISKGTARLEAGTTVYWQFPEFPFDSPVRVLAVEPPRLVRFCWDDQHGRGAHRDLTLTPGTTARRWCASPRWAWPTMRGPCLAGGQHRGMGQIFWHASRHGWSMA